MIVILGLLAVLIFFVAFARLGVVELSKAALETTRSALITIRKLQLEEAEKEQLAQQASIQLLRLFASIFMRCVLATIGAILPIVLADTLGLASRHDVTQFLSRWDVATAITLAIIVAYFAKARGWFRH